MLPDVPDVPVPPLPLEVVADKQPPAEARASRSAPDEPATHAAEDRKSTRLNSSHSQQSRMPSSA